WLLVGPEGACGTVQALRERGVLGAIQNIGIIPAWRGRRLGEALLLQSLHGMFVSGLGRAVLEVTAHNETAIRLYRRLGNRRSRELMLALDNLGLDRSESVGIMHMRFWGTTIARNLPAALEIYADILRRPHLPKEELEPVQALAVQDIKGLEDEPSSRVMIELRKHLYPAPLSNDYHGTIEGVE